MQFRHYRQLVFLFVLFFYYSLSAQTPEGARKQMNLGHYSDATDLYTALEELYPGQYQSELNLAKKCLGLQNRAKNKFKSEHFTEAESLYKQILSLNPNDQNARAEIKKCQESRERFLNAELAKCKTVDDYRLFAQRYPDSMQAETAKRFVKETEQKQQDEEEWNKAKKAGTIEAYRTYLSLPNPKASHKKEAYRNRARLYFAQGESAYSEANRKASYILAKSDYENAPGILNRDDDIKYIICCAEQKYAALGEHPTSSQLESYLSWARDHSSNITIYPHLRLKTVYAKLLDEYCNLGWFMYARTLVENNFGEISTSYFDPDAKKDWTLSEWQKYLKKREKEYKRRRPRTGTNTPSRTSPIGSGVDYPLMIGIPVKVASTFGGSVSAGINIGGWCAPFNVDVLVGYNAQKEKAIFSVDPMFNIKRYQGDEPFSDYHICVGPTLVYSEPQGVSFGIRSGIGLHYSNLSLGVCYGDDTGLYLDIALTFNLAHYHAREH